MFREFKITNHGTDLPTLGKATLDLYGEGTFPPHVSIDVEKVGLHLQVWVYASIWLLDGTGKYDLHHTIKHFDTVEEGWNYFRKIRELFGLEGV